MSTIKFKELVKMIHPDLNPEIQDAGTKMAQAKRHRDNPSILFDLAVRWGLIKGQSSGTTGRTHRTSNRTTYDTYDNDLVFTCGNEVIIRHRRRNIIGIITEIVNGKGKRKGHYKVFVADITSNRIYHFFLTNLNVSSVGGIRVMRKASDFHMESARKSYSRYCDYLERKKEVKKERKRRNEERTKQDLDPNTNYWHKNVWVSAITLKWMVRVTRTTTKRVYYWDYSQKKERFVNMSSVSFVHEREE